MWVEFRDGKKPPRNLISSLDSKCFFPSKTPHAFLSPKQYSLCIPF